MPYQIVDKQSTSQYGWGENCRSWILTESDELSIKLETMPAGSKETPHFHHHAQQFFYILKGLAHFQIDNSNVEVSRHQGILIPPQTKHLIINLSNEDLEFLIISQPSTKMDRIEIAL